jgi:flagellar basal-body rod modification protein FlgD
MASSGAVMASPIVSGTTPQSTSGSTASSANAMANQQIAGNFQTFLQLLTTQLQNQNPLDPLDTNQFTQQLVQFAGVQEQINTNDSLTTLVNMQQTAQATQALEFVGKTAIVSGNTTAMSNSKATWELNVPQTSTINVSIANSSGPSARSRRSAPVPPDLSARRRRSQSLMER